MFGSALSDHCNKSIFDWGTVQTHQALWFQLLQSEILLLFSVTQESNTVQGPLSFGLRKHLLDLFEDFF